MESLESNFRTFFHDTYKASVNKFDALKPETLNHCDRVVDRIKKIGSFIEIYLNIDQSDVLSYSIEAKCSYLNVFNDICLDVESKLDQSGENHPTVKKLQDNAAKIEELLSSGKNLIKASKFHVAVEIYSEAIDLKPSNDSIILELRGSRASANSKIGNFCDAINDYSEILKLFPDLTDVRLLRAQCYDYMDEMAECIEDYEFVLRTDSIKNDVKMTTDVQSMLKKARQKLKHNLAEQKNTNGNEEFKLRDYRSAVESYTQAIELWPNNALFCGNRCASLIKLGDYKRALQDAQYIVALDEKSAVGCRGYQHMIKCLLILGEYDDAGRALDKCIANMGSDTIIVGYSEIYQKLLRSRKSATYCCSMKLYYAASSYIKTALEVLPESIEFKFIKAECLLHLGRTEEIEQMVNEFGFSAADRLFLRSLCSYHDGDLEHTLSLLGQSVVLDLDHDRSLKMQKKIRSLIESFIRDSESHLLHQKCREVVEACTDAMEAFFKHRPPKLFAVLLYNRAMAHSQVGNFRDGISDCSEVLKTDEGNVKVLLLRAECYEYLEEFSESIEDYEDVLNSKSVKGNVVQSVQIQSEIEHLKTKLKHRKAEENKSKGDSFFDNQRYSMAVFYYDRAIDIWPDNISFHIKRIVCFVEMADYKQAIQKCQSAQSINNNISKINEFMAECSLILGDIYSATSSIQKCRETGTEKSKLNKYEIQLNELRQFTEKAKEYIANSNFEGAIGHIGKLLVIAHGSDDLKILKAECLALSGRIEEAVQCLQMNSSNADAVYVRALCVYATDLERGLQYLKRAIALDPDHSKTKALLLKLKNFKEKEETGSRLFKQEKYREASDNLSEALKIIPSRSPRLPTLLYHLAFSTSKIGHIRDAINHCTNAIKNKWLFAKFLKLRANCYMSMRNFGKAVDDFKTLHGNEPSYEAKNMLEQAQSSLKRQQSSNYYDILDIDKNETLNNIKKAYKKLALIHHPDKHSDAPQNELIEHLAIFKRINNAYATLSNPLQRAVYDRKNP